VQEVTAELRLPPLNALRAFEAAGRLQSIRQAAAELAVTPGAVSRQVRVLEGWLGVSLFRRTAHSINLTPVGESYLAAISANLHGIAAATEEIAGTQSDAQLRVRTWTLFASWLVPRLSDFRALYPGIEVQLIASSQRTDFGQADVDVEIIGRDAWGDEPGIGPVVDPGLLGESGYDAVRAVRSELVCVCSPSYLAGHQLETPDDLRHLGDSDLLHSLTAPDLWARWLRAAGVEGMDSRRGQLFGDSALTAAAARAGQGVAILPRTVLHDDIREGRLTVPIPSGYVNCAFDFYLLASPDQFRRRPVRVFREWLLEQAS
jgi:LysR family glycine cleavage system transcriptional activator